MSETLVGPYSDAGALDLERRRPLLPESERLIAHFQSLMRDAIQS